MFRIISRDGRTSRAFTIAALATLGACADEPVAPNVSRPLAPNASQVNAVVITVTNNSGDSEVGSLRWALAQATGGETIRVEPVARRHHDHRRPDARGVEVGNHPRPSFQNSIVAYNGMPRMNCAQIFEYRYTGSNLSDDASCGSAPNVLVADPMLGVLHDNGGPSATIDFAPQSPALNLGRLCALNGDQRYVPRDAFCDVGAFEFTDYTKITITTAPGVKVNTTTGHALLTGTIECTRNDAFRLALELHQDQKAGGQVVDVHAASDIPVACTTTAQPWSATMVLTDGAWKSGAATATAQTFNTPAWSRRPVLPPRSRSASAASRRAPGISRHALAGCKETRCLTARDLVVGRGPLALRCHDGRRYGHRSWTCGTTGNVVARYPAGTAL